MRKRPMTTLAQVGGTESEMKRKYEKPAMRVFPLRQTTALLQSSPLGNPSDYPGGGNPFSF